MRSEVEYCLGLFCRGARRSRVLLWRAMGCAEVEKRNAVLWRELKSSSEVN